MSARDVAFTLMALGQVTGCKGKTATEILAEAVGEIVRLQTALEKIAEESFEHNGNDHVLKLNQIAIHALEYKETK